jgi:hypothetical protein
VNGRSGFNWLVLDTIAGLFGYSSEGLDVIKAGNFFISGDTIN